MVISRRDWRDFQSVAQEYGMEIKSVDPGSGCRIVPDSEIAEDILFAISLLNDAEIFRNLDISGEVMPEQAAKFALSGG